MHKETRLRETCHKRPHTRWFHVFKIHTKKRQSCQIWSILKATVLFMMASVCGLESCTHVCLGGNAKKYVSGPREDLLISMPKAQV